MSPAGAGSCPSVPLPTLSLGSVSSSRPCPSPGYLFIDSDGLRPRLPRRDGVSLGPHCSLCWGGLPVPPAASWGSKLPPCPPELGPGAAAGPLTPTSGDPGWHPGPAAPAWGDSPMSHHQPAGPGSRGTPAWGAAGALHRAAQHANSYGDLGVPGGTRGTLGCLWALVTSGCHGDSLGGAWGCQGAACPVGGSWGTLGPCDALGWLLLQGAAPRTPRPVPPSHVPAGPAPPPSGSFRPTARPPSLAEPGAARCTSALPCGVPGDTAAPQGPTRGTVLQRKPKGGI